MADNDDGTANPPGTGGPPSAPGGEAPSSAAPPAPPPPKADPLKEPVPSRAVDILKERFADRVLEVTYHAGDAIVRIRPDAFLEIARVLRDDPELRFDYLSNLTAVHWPDRPRQFEIVYHMFSIAKRHRLTVKLEVAEGEQPPSACPVWRTANWHEREVFDLFGVRFAGHPDMTRILMTDEWVGHPLRKEYPLEGHPRDHMQLREVTTAGHVYRYDKATIKGFGWRKEVEKTGEGRG